MGGKVFHWEIVDQDKPTGRPEYPVTTTAKELFDQTFAHENAKPYTSFAYDDHEDIFVASMYEKNLVGYRRKGKERMFEYFNKDFSYTSLLLMQKAGVLLCGTSRGSICMHLWPPVFTDGELKRYRENLQIFKEIEFYEFQPQLMPINHLMVTPKEDQLISVSNDGMMFVLNIKQVDRSDVKEQKNQIDDKGGITQTVNEMFLVKNSYIKMQHRNIRDKEMEVARYEKRKITDAENKLREHRLKIQKIDKVFEQSKQSNEEHQKRFLKQSHANIEEQYRHKENIKAKLEQKSQELEKETQEMVAFEIERNQKLKIELEKTKEFWKEKLMQTAREQLETQKQLQEKYDANLADLKQKYETVLKDSAEYGTQFLKKIDLQEKAHESELTTIELKLNADIHQTTEQNEDLERNNNKLAQENDINKQEDVKLQKQFEDQFILNTKLQEDKVKIVVDLLKIQEQLLEREQVVFAKDETIKMARDEQINLENFQFMLDQKIKSLKKDKNMLDEEINLREKVLRDMFNELIKQSQMNNAHYNEIRARLQKIKILNEQKENIELQIYYWNVKTKDYHRKILAKLNSAQKVSEIKMLINKLIAETNEEQKHNPNRTVSKEEVVSMATASSDVGTSVLKELIEQNTWLIKKLNIIEATSKNIREIREENIETGLNQNKKLIEECNKLKNDNDFYHKKYEHYKKYINDFKRKEALQRELTKPSVKKGSSEGPVSGGLGSGSGLLPRLMVRNEPDNPDDTPTPRLSSSQANTRPPVVLPSEPERQSVVGRIAAGHTALTSSVAGLNLRSSKTSTFGGGHQTSQPSGMMVRPGVQTIAPVRANLRSTSNGVIVRRPQQTPSSTSKHG